MKPYVLGFVFAQNPRTCKWWVLLIRKNRPDWMAGHWNGLGGSIEGREIPSFAMTRELWEESGLFPIEEGWVRVANLIFGKTGVSVQTFATKTSWEHLMRARTTTDETVESFPVEALPLDVLPNVRWLVPMALHAAQNPAVTHPEILY